MDFYADFKVKLYHQFDGYPQLKESQICQMPAAILATNDECRFDPQKISPITGETRPRKNKANGEDHKSRNYSTHSCFCFVARRVHQPGQARGYFFLLGGNRSHERWSKEEQSPRYTSFGMTWNRRVWLADTKVSAACPCAHITNTGHSHEKRTARLAFENLFEQPANRVF